MGFTKDPETGMQVHYRVAKDGSNSCGRPTREFLDNFYRRLTEQEGE